MIVGAVLDAEGRPIYCELWPGNTADVMISKQTIKAVYRKELGRQYILGAHMRSQNEVKEEVLTRAGRYRVVHPQRTTSAAPAPLKVKEVRVEARPSGFCLNNDEAPKDAADRQAIVASLREKLRTGEKSLVGKKGYRRYLRSSDQDHF